MNIILPNNSLISSLVALSISAKTDYDVTVKKQNLNSANRLYSLNYFTKNYLDDLQIWKLLDKQKITPYKKIEIYKDKEKTIEFNASDVNVDFLGYIINEDDLVKIISNKVSNDKKIKKLDNIPLTTGKDSLNIISNHNDIFSNEDSINFVSKDYKQTAVNITFRHSNKNMGIPRQIFYKDEILGLLPVNENMYNLIWTMPNYIYKKVNSLNHDQYGKLINDRTSFLLGDISEIEKGKSFPLSSRHANKYFYNNYFLIGDSAHKFHPLAGLGLNMGIEDIATLTHLISSNYKLRKIATEYCIKRISRNYSLQKLLDIIIYFHSSKVIPREYQIRILRLFNKSLFLKPNIISQATGLDYMF